MTGVLIMATAEVDSCVFCRIIRGEDPATILYKDDDVIIFTDKKPASDHHFLIVPKKHITDASSLTSKDIYLIEKMIDHARTILRDQGADTSHTRYGFHWPPFRSVPHLHLHAISPTKHMSFFSRLIFRPNTFWFVTPEYVLERLSKL